jgi:hypothetical protein
MARNKDDIEKRKRKDYPHYCAREVVDDRAAWSSEVIRMEAWCRERVGVGGYAKQGRMGSERASLEFRFKTAEIATEFQVTFGGELGAEETEVPGRKPRAPRDLPALAETPRLEDVGEQAAEPRRTADRKGERRAVGLDI